MSRKVSCIFVFFCISITFGQITSKLFRSKDFIVKKDTIQIDSVSIHSQNFKLLDSLGNFIPKQLFKVDFSKAILVINSKKYSKITVQYFKFPEFITKVYTDFDKKLIVPNTSNTQKLYSLTTNKDKTFNFFDGLKPKGFIVRGLTSGNNQNAVTNSSLDLMLEGKLSENIFVKANIFDTNFPLQENGYSQNITDFDRIFVELYGKKWKLKGGDLSLRNKETTFLQFDKQVSGVEGQIQFNNHLNVLTSGAIVQGKYASFNFVGMSGNQGPYKIRGPNNETSMILIKGSERVYVNGIQLEQGEKQDYIIDYNLSEIRFNPTFPITNDMRIRIEFQYSDRNYTRFVTYNHLKYKTNKIDVLGFFYNENDAKNQPLQQSLTPKQQQVLLKSGNDTSKMFVQSAFADVYSKDKVQYKKIGNYFEYTTDPNANLYTVNFINVGVQKGSYAIDKTIAIGTIYKYVGKNSGSFDPVVQLVAPSSLQVAVMRTNYTPNQKTKISSEVAFSNYDKNLFSNIDDAQNIKTASKVEWWQKIFDRKWKLSSNVKYQYIQDRFQTVQRFQDVEFNRNWNLTQLKGDQYKMLGQVILESSQKDSLSYQFERLKFSNTYTGNKHSFLGKFNRKSTRLSAYFSLLDNSSTFGNSQFWQSKVSTHHSFAKNWLGTKFHFESNLKNNKNQKVFSTSHRFKDYEVFFGIGDTTNVFAKLGINYRENDSIRGNSFTQISNRKVLYIKSKLIANKNTNLSLYGNYQMITNRFGKNKNVLYSRLSYNQSFFKGFLSFTANYQTSSGNIARQNYIYVKTEPGQGYYTWIDYNQNKIQEFNEFEVATFQDQANYLRVALPNLTYVPTYQVGFKQSLTINPSLWKSFKGFKKVFSHFYNQTYLSINRERERINNSLNFNPFYFSDDKLLLLQYNFRNSLYFNKDMQRYSFVYTYAKTNNEQQFSIDNQTNKFDYHQLGFYQKLLSNWLFEITTSTATNQFFSDNLKNRNYKLVIQKINPKISYLYSNNHKLSLFYQYQIKQNQVRNFEKQKQHKLGLTYFFKGKKESQIIANFNTFLNQFEGNENTPVAYQMLEGLQKGRNFTWDVSVNKRLSSLLFLNLSYLGRKSNQTKTIHTGMVQLKAVF